MQRTGSIIDQQKPTVRQVANELLASLLSQRGERAVPAKHRERMLKKLGIVRSELRDLGRRLDARGLDGLEQQPLPSLRPAYRARCKLNLRHIDATAATERPSATR